MGNTTARNSPVFQGCPSYPLVPGQSDEQSLHALGLVSINRSHEDI